MAHWKCGRVIWRGVGHNKIQGINPLLLACDVFFAHKWLASEQSHHCKKVAYGRDLTSFVCQEVD